MSWNVVILIALGILFLTLFSGMRVFAALALTGIIIVWVTMGVKQEVLLSYSGWSTFSNYGLAAIPMFVLMGEIVFRSGVSGRAYNSIAPVLDRFPGGILHSNILAGAAFAACSGSSIASAVTIGRLALPETESRGYSKGLSMASVAAGASLGNLIPPSIHFIIYGILTRTSIGKLFIAGIMPGVMMVILYIAYISFRVLLKPDLAPRGQKISWGNSLLGLLSIWPIILLAVVVLGSIYGGLATPTEAAGVGVFAAVVISAAFRSLDWAMLKEASLATVKTTCFCMLILFGAQILGVLMTNIGALTAMARLVTSLSVSPVIILALVMLLYLVLGCFMSGLPAVVVTLPLTFPVVMSLGYDPLWFGVMIELMIELGMITPPVGITLYVLQGVRPKYAYGEIIRGMAPICLVIVIGLVLLTIFPSIATWLPSLM